MIIRWASLVGRTSFGKGVIQSTFPIEGGGALIMTTAEYFTPNNHRVHGVGLTPDIWVEREEDVVKVAIDWLRTEYGKTCPCQAPKQTERPQVRSPSVYSWFKPIRERLIGENAEIFIVGAIRESPLHNQKNVSSGFTIEFEVERLAEIALIVDRRSGRFERLGNLTLNG